MRIVRLAGLVATLAVAMMMTPSAVAAGGVTAEITAAGDLVIIGDADANELVVDQAGLSAGEFRITPIAGTTINGLGGAQTFSGVTGGIYATLHGGSDRIELERVQVAGDVIVGQRNHCDIKRNVASNKSTHSQCVSTGSNACVLSRTRIALTTSPPPTITSVSARC